MAKSRSRSLVGNLTSPSGGPLHLHPSHLTFATLIGILSVRPKGVAVKVGLRKALCPDEWRAPDGGLLSGGPAFVSLLKPHLTFSATVVGVLAYEH